jgi:hypothetical protein
LSRSCRCSPRSSEHVEPKHTFWYFEATPELLALAADRLERAWDQPRARKDEQ